LAKNYNIPVAGQIWDCKSRKKKYFIQKNLKKTGVFYYNNTIVWKGGAKVGNFFDGLQFALLALFYKPNLNSFLTKNKTGYPKVACSTKIILYKHLFHYQ